MIRNVELMKKDLMRDYLDAIGKIEPQYQQEAFAACAAVILEEMQRRHS